LFVLLKHRASDLEWPDALGCSCTAKHQKASSRWRWTN
jgi:hypothetical protein